MRWALLAAAIATLVCSAPVHPRPAPDANRVLFQAAYHGDAARIDALLRARPPGLNLTAQIGSDTVIVALLSGWHALVESFMPDAAGELVARSAVYNTSLHALLRAGASPTQMCPIMDAISFRNVAALEALLQASGHRGAVDCITATSTAGRNRLHEAAQSAASGLARIMFRSRRMDSSALAPLLHHLNVDGDAPLWSGRDELHKADIERATSARPMLLLLEALQQAVDALVDDDAEVTPDLVRQTINAADPAGLTPLMIAAQDGREREVRHLLALGANTSAQCAAGLSAADLARSQGYLSIAEELDAYGTGAVGEADVAADGTVKAEAVDHTSVPDSLFGWPLRCHTVDAKPPTDAAAVAPGWCAASSSVLQNMGFHAFDESHPATDGELSAVAPVASGMPGLRRLHHNDSAAMAEQMAANRPFVVLAPPSFRPWSRRQLLHRYGGLTVRTGHIPYASTYGNVSESVSVRRFAELYMPQSCSQREYDHLQRYVFDAQVMHRNASLFTDVLASFPELLVRGRTNGMRQFILGPPLSGAMPHFHGAAVNLLLTGLKLWVLYPPASAYFAQLHAAEWFRDSYVPNDGCAAAPRPHYRVLQRPGDIVYVPVHWGHAVLNLVDSFAVALE